MLRRRGLSTPLLQLVSAKERGRAAKNPRPAGYIGRRTEYGRPGKATKHAISATHEHAAALRSKRRLLRLLAYPWPGLLSVVTRKKATACNPWWLLKLPRPRSRRLLRAAATHRALASPE